jgi:aspartate-semialdehyde dehydrogenase
MNRSRFTRCVGILGATGVVGQRLISLLENHPWFSLGPLGASDRSVGKSYAEAAHWHLDTPLPPALCQREVLPCDPSLFTSCDLVLSALDASVAGEIEARFAHAGFPVVSNAKNYRLEPAVPLVIPEVNADHLTLIEHQRERWHNRGYIVTNPNCTTIGLALSLKPLAELAGLARVHVVSLQALSGAGYPGVPSLDIVDNVVPFIPGEEEKVICETAKILGTSERPADFPLSAQCNRVPVLDGHLECVYVETEHPLDVTAAVAAWGSFKGRPQELKLPTAPAYPIVVRAEVDRPQPRRDRLAGGGMTVSVGRVVRVGERALRFVNLSHNTIRGAAGAALLNAELLVAEGWA